MLTNAVYTRDIVLYCPPPESSQIVLHKHKSSGLRSIFKHSNSPHTPMVTTNIGNNNSGNQRHAATDLTSTQAKPSSHTHNTTHLATMPLDQITNIPLCLVLWWDESHHKCCLKIYRGLAGLHALIETSIKIQQMK